jgi:hypothetical protein
MCSKKLGSKDKKYDLICKEVQAEIDRLVAELGQPKNEEEAIDIFTRAWEKLGYKVVDGRKER